MANDEHVEMLKKGAEAWDKWRREKDPNRQMIHRTANVGGANVRVAIYREANLGGVVPEPLCISQASC
jgi:hypothetical protein